MTKILIQTTQNVPIEFNTASAGKRIVAGLIDLLILYAYVFVMLKIFEIFQLFDIRDNWSRIAVFSLAFLPVFLYTLLMEYFLDGQTFGKKIMHIKVVKPDGYSPVFTDFLIRWLFRIVDIWILTPVVGIISMIVNDKGRRIGDVAAGTVLIDIHKKHRLDSTILEQTPESYSAVFPSVIMLSDRDVRIIKDNYRKAVRRKDENLLKALREKVEQTIRVSGGKMPDREFIETVLKDYTALTKDS